MTLRYLDQERDEGEDSVFFAKCDDASGSLLYGDPSGVSLRDHDMAVTGLRLEVGSYERLAVLREPKGYHPEVVVVRGCTIVATLGLSELPVRVAGIPVGQTGPYGSSPPCPLPVYLYNPARQNLSITLRGELPVPVKVRLWWQRLERRT